MPSLSRTNAIKLFLEKLHVRKLQKIGEETGAKPFLRAYITNLFTVVGEWLVSQVLFTTLKLMFASVSKQMLYFE